VDIHDKSQGVPQQGAPGQALEIDQFKLDRYMNEVRDNQRLFMGLVGGIGAAVIGAAVWALITILTNHQYGLMAIGVGFLVGYAVRLFGKGIDTIFGVTGAAVSLLGCVAGNFLTVLVSVSRQEGIPFLDLISRVTPGIIGAVLKDTFQPMDLLFYGLATYFGYKYSFKPLTTEELAKLTR
jgi:hypothetical protein